MVLKWTLNVVGWYEYSMGFLVFHRKFYVRLHEVLSKRHNRFIVFLLSSYIENLTETFQQRIYISYKSDLNQNNTI